MCSFYVCQIYLLRGLKDASILKPLDELRNLLGFPTDEDLDANEFLSKLLGQILKDEVSDYLN